MSGARPGGPDRFALIIGAMKSGTTSLFEYLADHPAVAPCRVKEPHFFADAERARGGLAGYRSLWDWRPGVHRIALEASTSYAMLPDRPGVPARVGSVAEADFRLIYIMRDPVERMISQLRHVAIRRGGADRLSGGDFERAVQYSRYAMQLDAWTARFPRDAILPLVYEELLVDPAAPVQRAQLFLGLSPRPPAPDTLERAHNTATDLAADQALDRALSRAPWLEPLTRWVPEGVRRAVRGLAARGRGRPLSLEPARRERALETLAPEAERIRAEWEVDTSAWRSVP